jgi:hypothetical protein
MAGSSGGGHHHTTIHVTFKNDGLGIIKQEMSRRSAEGQKRLFNTVTPGRRILTGIKAYKGCPTPTQRGDNCQQRVPALSYHRKIDLHLLTGLRLKTHDGVVRLLLKRKQESRQHTVSTEVPAKLDLTQHNAGWYPMGSGSFNPF